VPEAILFIELRDSIPICPSVAKARPIHYYQKVLSAACHARDAPGLLLVSTTASPNLALAAASFEVPVILFNYRLKEHQLFHQDETAIDFFKPEVSPVQAPIFSPTLRTHPQYLSCKVVQECFLMIEDIGPKYESDKWCGCDLVARPLQSLVEEEAAEFKLSMAASKAAPGKVGIYSTQRLDEGQTVCHATAVFFTKKETLRDSNKDCHCFLNSFCFTC
jgi:hypothetical protein